MDKTPIIIFSYPIDGILEEVTKRTSYYGKMRGTEQEPMVLDRLSLTEGEGFLFTEFIEDAASNVYEWLQAFGRNIKHAYHAKCVYDETVQYKNHGAYITMEGDETDNGKAHKFENIARDTTIISPIKVTAPSVVIDNRVQGVNATIDYTFTIHSILGGTLEVKETFVHSVNKTLAANEQLTYINDMTEDNTISIPFEIMENGDMHDIQRVDVSVVVNITPANPETIKAETYVEYHPNLNDLSAVDYYQVVDACTSADWERHADKLPSDPRGNIMFVLEQMSYFDTNRIHSIDRNIKEALVNFIIYRWYEFVNPAEYEHFFDKYEVYAHKAQLGMNSEVKVQQRRYKLF